MISRIIGFTALLCVVVLPLSLIGSGRTGAEVWGPTLCALIGVGVLDWISSRGHPWPSPLRVYLMIAGTVGLLGLGAYLLSFLGLGVVVALLVVLAGLVTALNVVRQPGVRRVREQMGHCPECGYDLRMTRERCPECNAPVPASLERRRRIARELRAARGHNGPAAAASPPSAE